MRNVYWQVERHDLQLGQIYDLRSQSRDVSDRKKNDVAHANFNDFTLILSVRIIPNYYCVLLHELSL